MAKKRAYTLRYGETNQRDFMVYFDSEETVLQNLITVIPPAIQRGFLPADCAPDKLKLLYQGQELNPNVSLQEQAPNIPERSILILRDQKSTVRMRIKYKPDHEAVRTDSVNVSPGKALKPQLEDFFGEISKTYKFYGRPRKAYKLVHEGKKLNLDKSLAASGIESGIDVLLEPKAFLRWPPSRPQIFGLVTVLVLLIAVAAYYVWVNMPRPIETFYLSFNSDVECVVESPDTSFTLTPGEVAHVAVEPGVHSFEIMPSNFPIFTESLQLVAETAERDSVDVSLSVAERYSSTEKVKLYIGGYRGPQSPENRLLDPVYINGKPRSVDEFGNLEIDLFKGEYDIRYNGLDDYLKKVDFDADNVLHPSTFRFDFSSFGQESTALTFEYTKE